MFFPFESESRMLMKHIVRAAPMLLIPFFFLALLALPTWNYFDLATFAQREKTVTTTGTVINLYNDGEDCYPIIRFRTLQGQFITFKSLQGNDYCMNKIGDTLAVMYHLNQPDDVRPAISDNPWIHDLGLTIALWLVMGSLIVIFSYLYLHDLFDSLKQDRSQFPHK